ncbi:MAG TPA: FGGY family carbohydrate kinase, partial [Clostridia bacterium]|nr:FGGY family carbohydrate kinase [Clostridia bacterium]
MQTKILTLDAGTTGLKATLFDLEGKALAAAVSPYPVHFPRCEWAEQPCETILRAACKAGRTAVEAGGAEGIAAIGLSGTMNGCLPVDASGNALYPNIIHADTRAVAQLDILRAAVGEETYYSRTGNRIDVHYTL